MLSPKEADPNMTAFRTTVAGETYKFGGLTDVMAKATPARSGDALAGIAAHSDTERVAAQMVLADLPLKTFLQELVVPYEADEVSRLIIDSHDVAAFAPVSHFTVGQFRDWLLSDAADTAALADLSCGLIPEMAAAVCKLMRNRDLIAVARKIHVTTAFRSTLGQPGRIGSRLQPNHPADDLKGIAASTLDGLTFGVGDAVIGVNPATDNMQTATALLSMLE